MTTIVIGIDPGLSGAIAMLTQNGLQAVEDLPVVEKGSGQATIKQEINPSGLAMILRHWTQGEKDEVMVVLERASGRPTVINGQRIPQGSASVFSTGDTYGAIRATVATIGYRLELVTPGSWKGYLGLPGGKNHKELARAYAIQKYPSADLHRKKDHGKAEAILIARYGWEVLR